jgi:hypothetical protein
MLLRNRGNAVVRATTFVVGSRLKGHASAWIVGWWAKAFSRLLARRSITQKEAAVDGQVWAAAPLAGCDIAWQWVIAAAGRLPG